jgi:SAM-dependent methyltransferase
VPNLDGSPHQTCTDYHDSWEAAYNREIQNHKDDTEDEGIVWFDESNAEDTVLDKLDEYSDAAGRALLDRRHCRFLDLGTGNGHMLFELREREDDEGERWLGDMVGVDYSPRSIELARQIDEQRRAALRVQQDESGDHNADDIAAGSSALPGFANVTLHVWDLLTETAGDWLNDGFDVVLDKGTFDAISLMSPEADGSPHPCDRYRRTVAPLIKRGGYLVITSCNWTKNELLEWLVPQDGELTLLDEARYPTFMFGGTTGQSVVTLVLQRRQSSE